MAKCESHTWERVKKRGKTYEVCTECDTQFPCKAYACGHLDCEEERGKAPKCQVCSTAVRGSARHFVFKRGGKCFVVHEDCGGDDIAFSVVFGTK